MKQRKKAVFNWSGGKDSAFALYKVLQGNEYEVIALLTTVDADTLSSSIHSIPLEIIEAQAESIGIPVYVLKLPTKDMSGYEQAMEEAVLHFKNEGVTHFIFGDIFLHDVKTYRENKLKPYAIEVVEPLWDKTPEIIMEEFLASGIRSKIIVTQADKLDQTFIGRELDREFVESLPENVDRCGENGEYHTLAYAGPLFKHEIKHSLSEPQKLSFDIKMDDGKMHTFHYWQAKISMINVP
jgi:uncharacterized protein (TIGR00290 family)